MPNGSLKPPHRLIQTKRRRLSRRVPGRAAAAMLILLVLLWGISAHAMPKHVILCIGDGMGPEQIRAGGMFAHGREGTLSFEALPHRAMVDTRPRGSDVTDSAAAATAMATGVKVKNGVISRAIPGNGEDLKTILEIAMEQGKAAGIVTTTAVTHATPAAFVAHSRSRMFTAEIAGYYLQHTRPQLIFGGGGTGMTVADTRAAGYRVVSTGFDFQNLTTAPGTRVAALFGTTHLAYVPDRRKSQPGLEEIVKKAIGILAADPDGFFLLIEGGRIDHAGHGNDIERLVREVAEFSEAVQVVIDWGKDRKDTLILVTADHETGGLQVLKNHGAGKAPEVAWKTTGHTAASVRVFALGENAHQIQGRMDNTDLFGVMAGH